MYNILLLTVPQITWASQARSRRIRTRMSQSSLRKWVWSWSRDFVSETKTAEIINSRITVITDPEPISLWLSWPSLPRPPTVNPLILADHSCARTLTLTNTRARRFIYPFYQALPGPGARIGGLSPETPSRELQPWWKRRPFVADILSRFSCAHSLFPLPPYWEFPRQKRRTRSIKCNGSLFYRRFHHVRLLSTDVV